MSVDQGVRGHVAPDRGDRSQPSRLQRNYAVLHLLLEKLRQLVGSDFQSSGETVLDFGSGSRPYESLLRTKFRRYLAADFPGNDEADVTICPEGRLSLPDQEFDCVLSTQVLEHVEDPRVYLGEAYRVLKPGGTLVLSTHGIWRYHPDPLDHWRWTADGLRLEICRAGFEMEGLESVLGLAGCALQLWQDATTGPSPAWSGRCTIWSYKPSSWPSSVCAGVDSLRTRVYMSSWRAGHVPAWRRLRAEPQGPKAVRRQEVKGLDRAHGYRGILRRVLQAPSH